MTGLVPPATDSQVFDGRVPWCLHPNTRGRDIQATHVATAIQNTFSA
ncbi:MULTISPECIES: hypothetical protein [unclassified Saccharothrix]